MAKNDGKQTQQNIHSNISAEQNQSNTGYNDFLAGLPKQGDLVNAGNQERSNLLSGYQNQIDNSLGADEVNRLRGIYSADNPLWAQAFGGGGSGISVSGKNSRVGGLSLPGSSFAAGVHIPDSSAYKDVVLPTGSSFTDLKGPDFSKVNAGYEGFTGPNKNTTMQQLQGLATTGGYSPEDIAGIQRENLLNQEKTGGYTPQDIAMARAKAASSSAATFAGLQNDIDRGRRVSGNLAGNNALDFKLARDKAQQGASDKIDSEIKLAESIRTGKFDASKLLSSNAADIVTGRTKNQLDALTGLSQNELDALAGLRGTATDTSDFALNRAKGLDLSSYNNANLGLTKASGLDTFGINAADLGLKQGNYQDQYALGKGDFDFRNASYLDSLDNQASGAGAAAANANAANARWMMDNQGGMEQFIAGGQQQGAQFGLNGLNSMYGSSYGPSDTNNDFILRGLAGRSGANQGTIGLDIANNAPRGNPLLDTIMKGVNAGGQVITGINDARKKNPTPTPTPANPTAPRTELPANPDNPSGPLIGTGGYTGPNFGPIKRPLFPGFGGPINIPGLGGGGFGGVQF